MKAKNLFFVPLVAFGLLTFSACSNTDTPEPEKPKLETKMMQNKALMDILKTKGYTFDEKGALVINEMVTNTTSLDLSETKITDFTDLNLLPNLKELKLSKNGYGPVFDFKMLPEQITAVDLTDNNIYDFENFVDVKVAENDEEIVKDLHLLTKLYLPTTAKYNSEDLARYYRQHKDDIASGKIDMKMADDKGALQVYNTLRTISDPDFKQYVKTNFSSIMAADGEQIDLSKRMSEDDATPWMLGLATKDSKEGELNTIDADAMYILNHAYLKASIIALMGNEKATIPYFKPNNYLADISFIDITLHNDIDYSQAKELKNVQMVDVKGLKTMNLTNNKMMFVANEDRTQESEFIIAGCTDLENILFPTSDKLHAQTMDLVNLPKLNKLDLAKFSWIGKIQLAGLLPNIKIDYPTITDFIPSTPEGSVGRFWLALTKEVYQQTEGMKNFIKKYYDKDSSKSKIGILDSFRFMPIGYAKTYKAYPQLQNELN